jgi:hypothetical protein
MRSGYFDDAKPSAFQVKCPDPVLGRDLRGLVAFRLVHRGRRADGVGYRDILAVVQTNPAKCRQWRGPTYQIQVQNPGRVEKGVASILLNGKPVPGGTLPPQPAGSVNQVLVEMD